jgi:hypothetical protein
MLVEIKHPNNLRPGTDVLRDGRGVVGQKIADSDENVEIRRLEANLQTDRELPGDCPLNTGRTYVIMYEHTGSFIRSKKSWDLHTQKFC